MQRLHNWHVWLGWLIGIPVILWTASGLFMAARPIDAVRGTDLRAEATPMPPITPVAPMLEGRAVEELSLLKQDGRPVWVIGYSDGGRRRADARSGALLGPVGGAEAMQLANAARRGTAEVRSVTRTPADNPPLDLRRPRPAWAVNYADGARFYIDADSGELMAVRTRYWRIYDFMWGLHIMDLQTRERISHPVLIVFAALSLFAMLIGAILMLRRRRWIAPWSEKLGEKRRPAG